MKTTSLQTGKVRFFWLCLACIFIAVSIFIVFYPAAHFEFLVWDDYQNIVENPNIQGFSLGNIRWMFTTFHLGPYQPLSWISLALDYRFWKLEPFGYHLMNIFWHSINGACFFMLILMLLKAHRENFISSPAISGYISWEVFAAFTGALFFALHPLRVESVVWATERRDVLCGFFFLLTLLTYLRAGQSANNPSKRRYLWYFLSLIFFFLSLLAKAMSVILAPVLVLLDYYPLKRATGGIRGYFRPESRKILMEKIPFFLLSIIIGLVAIVGQMVEAERMEAGSLPFIKRMLVVFYGIFYYLRKTFFPNRLAPFYNIIFDLKTSNPFVFLSPVFVLFITAALFLYRRAYPWLIAVWLTYLIMILPVSGIFQSGMQIVADRYSYLPTLGFFILIGAWFGVLFRHAAHQKKGQAKRLWPILFFIAILAGTVYQTRSYMYHWQNSETLWNLEKRYYPYEKRVYLNMGEYFARSHRIDDGVQLFMEGIQRIPNFAQLYNNLAVFQVKQGKIREAVEAFQKSIKIKPDYAEAYKNLGLLYLQNGEHRLAVPLLQRSIDLGYPDANIKNDLAWVYATSSDPQIRDGGKALELARGICEETEYKNPAFLDSLAAAYAETGDYARAEEYQRKAMELLVHPEEGFSLRLNAYRSKRPWRETR